MADRLYNETKQFLENHVQNLLVTQVAPSEGDNSNEFIVHDTLLQRYYIAWKEYSQGVEYLNFLYQYLNQQHIKRNKFTADVEFNYGSLSTENQELMEIGELGLDIWRGCMIKSLGEEIVKEILEVIHADRIGSDLGSNSAQVIHGIIQSFVSVQDYKKKGNLNLYQELFEAPMLAASGEYYKSEASKLLQRCTVSEYMEEVLKRLDDENRRAHKFFHGRWVDQIQFQFFSHRFNDSIIEARFFKKKSQFLIAFFTHKHSSIPKLRQECELRMITDHLDFLHSDCQEMVSQEKSDDLHNMYILLKPIPDGLKTLVQAFLDHIKNEGIETISTLKGDTVRDTPKSLWILHCF